MNKQRLLNFHSAAVEAPSKDIHIHSPEKIANKPFFKNSIARIHFV